LEHATTETKRPRKIIGKPVTFAYPFLTLESKLLQKLKKWISNGIYTFYKRDIAATVYTIRRMIVSKLENRGLLPAIEATFQD
jgi:hypothetical protein